MPCSYGRREFLAQLQTFIPVLVDCSCLHVGALGSVLMLSFPFTEHAAVLLHRAFLVGMYGQIDTSSQISEALKVLHMEAMI